MYEWEDEVIYGWIIAFGCNVYTIFCDSNTQVVFYDLFLHFLQRLLTAELICRTYSAAISKRNGRTKE